MTTAESYGRRASRDDSYQLDRARRPSSNDVAASNPNALARPTRVERAARLAVGLRGVPADLALEAGQADDQLDQLADRDLAPDAEVDRLGAVVALGGEDDPLGGVVDVQELARGRAGAPDLDVVGARVAGVDALLDQGGDDVRAGRVEVVAGAVEVDRDQVDDVEAVLLRGTPGPGRAASSWRGRTARSSPPGSRSRGRPRGTAPA